MPRKVAKPESRITTNYAFDTRLDLNLFRVFDAIYTHGGISGAAHALHLTQPAISHSLARLREAFDDPLFVRQGNQMIPTERTRMIIGDIRAHLHGLFTSVHDFNELNPAQLDVEFRFALRDILESSAMPLLMKHLDKHAPKIRITCRQVARENFEKEMAAGSLDFAIDRRMEASPDMQRLNLVNVPVAVVASTKRFPIGKKKLTVEDYLSARHAVVTHLEGRDPIDSILAETGIKRRIGYRGINYFSACRVVAVTDMLLTMPKAFAVYLTKFLPIRVIELPLPVKPIEVYLYWHASRENDRSHRWLREQLVSFPAKYKWAITD